MINTNSEISFYVDTMIVEALLSDDRLLKTADEGLVSSLVQKGKDYFGAQIDPNDKEGSLLRILAPGLIWTTLGALGMGTKFRFLLFLLSTVFQVDLGGMLSSMFNKLKELILSKQPITSNHVDEIVNNTVQEHNSPATDEDAQRLDKLQEKGAASKDIRFFKLLVGSHQPNLIKTAGNLTNTKITATNLFGKIVGWVFKIGLASAGLMVAGDVVNKLLGRSTPLDKVIPKTDSTQTQTQVTTKLPTQTKFKVKSSYSDQKYNSGESNWVERVNNDDASIGNMLVGFVKDVYDGLDGKENLIRMAPAFQVIKDRITWYNHNASGDPIVFIPKYLTSKKQIADLMIDEIAAESPELPAPTKPNPGAYKGIYA